MFDPNEFMRFDDDTPKKPNVKLKRQGNFFQNFWGGHHQSKYTVPVPEGMDPYEFSDHISTGIGKSAAPGAKLDKPGETPTLVKTIGQPSWVSKASSEDKSEHNVMVEADPNHLLGGKNGTSAGINYATHPKQKKNGQWKVVTEKESFGDSCPLLGPLRFLVGSTVIDSHIKNGMENVFDQYSPNNDSKD
jgi:hypothetical protein